MHANALWNEQSRIIKDIGLALSLLQQSGRQSRHGKCSDKLKEMQPSRHVQHNSGTQLGFKCCVSAHRQPPHEKHQQQQCTSPLKPIASTGAPVKQHVFTTCWLHMRKGGKSNLAVRDTAIELNLVVETLFE